MVVLNTNALHKVNDWTLELEEKVADIIPHIQTHWQQKWWFKNIQYLLKVVLQIILNPSSIAACHPFNQV